MEARNPGSLDLRGQKITTALLIYADKNNNRFAEWMATGTKNGTPAKSVAAMWTRTQTKSRDVDSDDGDRADYNCKQLENNISEDLFTTRHAACMHFAG